MTLLICGSVFVIASFFGMVIYEIIDPEVLFITLFGLVSVAIALGVIILKKISLISKNDDKGSDSKQENSEQS